MLTAVCFFQITALKIKHNPFAKAFLDAKERLRLRTPLTPQWVKLACSYVASNPVFLIAGVTIKKCPITAQTVNSLDILNVSTGWHLCIKADAGCYMYIFKFWQLPCVTQLYTFFLHSRRLVHSRPESHLPQQQPPSVQQHNRPLFWILLRALLQPEEPQSGPVPQPLPPPHHQYK